MPKPYSLMWHLEHGNRVRNGHDRRPQTRWMHSPKGALLKISVSRLFCVTVVYVVQYSAYSDLRLMCFTNVFYYYYYIRPICWVIFSAVEEVDDRYCRLCIRTYGSYFPLRGSNTCETYKLKRLRKTSLDATCTICTGWLMLQCTGNAMGLYRDCAVPYMRHIHIVIR